MNHRDTQIEEYIRGRMPEGQRKEFEAELAADPALRRSVQVEQAIADTIRRDALAGMEGASTEIPPLLSAKLASTAAAGLPQVAGTGVLGTIFGTKMGITILSIVGGLGILLGVLLIAPLFDTSSTKEAIPQTTIRQEGTLPSLQKGSPEKGIPSSTSAAGRSAIEAGAAQEHRGSAAGEESRGRAYPSAKTGSNSTSPLPQGTVIAGGEKKEETTAPHAAPSTTTAQEMLQKLQQEEKERKTPRIKKESTEVQVKIE